MLAINTQLSAEQRLSKNITQIMGNPKYVALAGVLMISEKGIKDDCPTAYTNGRDDYYGRAFVDGLADSEFRFLILHETYHKLFKQKIQRCLKLLYLFKSYALWADLKN